MPHFTVNPGVTSWTIGEYTTPLLDISLQAHPDTADDQWHEVRWIEQETEDESFAYVRVDILDSSDGILQSNLSGTQNGVFKSIDLSAYSNVKTADIKIKFKLYGKNKSPIVSKIRIR